MCISGVIFDVFVPFSSFNSPSGPPIHIRSRYQHHRGPEKEIETEGIELAHCCEADMEGCVVSEVV